MQLLVSFFLTSSPQLLDGRLSTEISLDYAQSFLDLATLERKRPLPGGETWSMRPSVEELKDVHRYNLLHWKGACCPRCGRLNCRFVFDLIVHA